MTVLAFDFDRTTNAELMKDCFTLGFLNDEQTVWETTWGKGSFWDLRRPYKLIGSDINPDRARDLVCDYRSLPAKNRSVDVVVFDPPYKLNGTPAMGEMDDRYGTNQTTRWQGRMDDILDGALESFRVSDDWVLVKCQDQVVSGRKVWQTDAVSALAEMVGYRKVDRLEVFGYRPQPEGRSQKHARQVTSSLLVFRREDG